MLSIIIPVRNEEKNVIPLIQKLENVLKQKNYELIFIDDYSTDGTLSYLRKISRKKTFIRVIQKKNQKIGVGISIKLGISHSKGKFILTMDADLSHNPLDILKFLDELDEDTDLIVGSRYLEKSKYIMHNPRKILSKLFNLFLKLLFRVPLSDITSGFRLIKKEKLLKLQLEAENFDIHPELNLKAIFSHFKIKEIPIVFSQRQRGKSKLNYFQMFFYYLKLILKLLFHL